MNDDLIAVACECCGKEFYVNYGEEWKIICYDCYKKYYLPLKGRYRFYQLKGRWKAIREKKLAQKSQVQNIRAK